MCRSWPWLGDPWGGEQLAQRCRVRREFGRPCRPYPIVLYRLLWLAGCNARWHGRQVYSVSSDTLTRVNNVWFQLGSWCGSCHMDKAASYGQGNKCIVLNMWFLIESLSTLNALKCSKCVFHSFSIQGQVMFRNGERMGTIKFTQFQGTVSTCCRIVALLWCSVELL